MEGGYDIFQETNMTNVPVVTYVVQRDANFLIADPRFMYIVEYRKVSNIRRTKSQNLNASRLILLLSLPNPLKPGVKLSMKM